MKPRRLPQATVRTELSLTNESESASLLSHQIVRYFRSPTLHLLPKQWQLDSSGSTGPRRIQKHKKNILMWKLVRALLVKSAFGRAVVVVMAVGGVAGWRGSGRWEGGAVGCSSPSCQPPLSARRAGCVGRPGSSAADASPHVRGRQWPAGAPLPLIPHWAISPSRWRAAAGAPLPDNYQASPQMEMSVSLTGPGSCHCLRPRPLYLSRALPTLTMCSVTAD